jgi:hypothetical protein
MNDEEQNRPANAPGRTKTAQTHTQRAQTDMTNTEICWARAGVPESKRAVHL